ncbi:MAG: DUF5717 family protein [Lachnospiraceae bacterium]
MRWALCSLPAAACMKGAAREPELRAVSDERLRAGNVHEEFRMQLRAAVLHYYSEHARDDSLPDFLERIAYLDYVKADKAALISLLAEEGECKDAFSLLDMYGSEGIPLYSWYVFAAG